MPAKVRRGSPSVHWGSMGDERRTARYRFGVFELDGATGELRRQGVRIRLHAQPFQVLRLLLERPGEMLTREEISRELWPAGTFVDYEHGVNSAVNRLREALGDKARNPRFVETIARRGYRFLAPVERMIDEVMPGQAGAVQPASEPNLVAASPALKPRSNSGLLSRVLASPEDLPAGSPGVVRTLFFLLQVMYAGFYVSALANLPEIADLLGVLPRGPDLVTVLTVTAAMLIPVRVFLICAVLFRAPRLTQQFIRIWPVLLGFDVLWALAPFLLLHHIPFGLALACTTVLVYAPFAQRSLMLMGAGSVLGSSVTKGAE